ncbi:MAG: hypothetical protein D6753_08200 [Planctomycetota bacterium]|nr:MAG: hypothetical protein D6753_08200 [Planctomycetota bacterium]
MTRPEQTGYSPVWNQSQRYSQLQGSGKNMVTRRRWFAVLAGVVALGMLPVAQAQEGNSLNSAERLTERNVVSLEDQLTKGLRTFRADQQQWIKLVVVEVENQRLPRAMVNVVFKWARQRNPKVPFPYFQFAMRELAKRRGVILP